MQRLRPGSGPPPALDATLLAQVVQQLQQAAPYKQQFVVKVGEYLKVVPVETIRYFSSSEGTTFLHTPENRHYVIDHTLEQLEKLVDPRGFFRLNRAFLVHRRIRASLPPSPTETPEGPRILPQRMPSQKLTSAAAAVRQSVVLRTSIAIPHGRRVKPASEGQAVAPLRRPRPLTPCRRTNRATRPGLPRRSLQRTRNSL